MALNQRLWAELNSTFEQDLPATTQLLHLLESERKALEQRKYDDFQEIVSDKHALLAQLETHSTVRQQLLEQAGFTDERSCLQAAGQQAPATAKAWQQLGTQWLRCQELNEINEKIAKRTRLVVGQILDLMRGQSNQPKLYNQSGDTSASNSGRTITSV